MKLIDIMENYLKDESYGYNRQDDRIRLSFTKPDHRVTINVYTNEERRTLMVRAEAGVMIPEEKRSAISEFVTRVNYCMYIGGFQMDLRDGEVFFQSSLIAPSDLPQTMMEPLLDAAVGTYSYYHPAIMAILYQNAQPLDALAQIDGKPEATPAEVDESVSRLLSDVEEPQLNQDEAKGKEQ